MPAPADPADMAQGPMVPAQFALAGRHQETSDTWTLELQPRAGAALAFAPGQFTMLSAFATGEVPISISGDSRPARAPSALRAPAAALWRALARAAALHGRAGAVVGART